MTEIGLNWKQQQLRPAGVRFSVVVASVAAIPLTELVAFMRPKLSGQTAHWDVLKIEYWGEGRVVLYPGASTSDERVDVVTFDLLFTDLRERESRYDSMEDEVVAEKMVDGMLEELRVGLGVPLSQELGVPIAFRPYGEEH